MLAEVLDLLLEIFACDRAWLFYPCDPHAETWSAPMEQTTPDYPGAFALGEPLPMTPAMAEICRIVLESPTPVTFGPGGDYPLTVDVSDPFAVQSQLTMALRPNRGKPWVFGLHQCRNSRVWGSEEQRLFQEAGRRLDDTLTGLLAYRDLQHSEQRYREVFENSSDGIFLLDVTPDGHFRFAGFNPAEERAIGLSSEQMNGRYVKEALPPPSGQTGVGQLPPLH